MRPVATAGSRGRALTRRAEMATAQGQKAATGWIGFAGVMLIIVGLLDVVDGLWALDRSNGKSAQLLYADKLGGWGWFYLILGVVLVLAGIGVFYRSQLARWVGIILASVAIVSNMLWVFFAPSVVIIHILLASLVVYGLVVYGEPE